MALLVITFTIIINKEPLNESLIVHSLTPCFYVVFMPSDFVYSDIDISLFTAIKTFIITKINSLIGLLIIAKM